MNINNECISRKEWRSRLESEQIVSRRVDCIVRKSEREWRELISERSEVECELVGGLINEVKGGVVDVDGVVREGEVGGRVGNVGD